MDLFFSIYVFLTLSAPVDLQKMLFYPLTQMSNGINFHGLKHNIKLVVISPCLTYLLILGPRFQVCLGHSENEFSGITSTRACV